MAKVNWKVIMILIIAIVTIVVALIVLFTSGTQDILSPQDIPRPQDIPPEKTPTNGTKCKTKDNTPGVCLPYDQCISSHSRVDSSMIRSSLLDACTSDLWCCPETGFPKPNISCTPLTSDICPWCVTLHRVIDKSQMDKKAFCMGSLVSPKIILTTATCLTASKNYTLFARVPASTKKLKNYYANMQILNPFFESATHINDFGLIILNEAVEWGNKAPQFACLNYEEIDGNCMTFGLDGNDDFVSTIIETTEENCNVFGGGESLEAKCGKNTDSSDCFATEGAPVVCKTEKSTGGELIGVARSNCVKDEILLGQLAGSKMFLIPLFPRLTKE